MRAQVPPVACRKPAAGMTYFMDHDEAEAADEAATSPQPAAPPPTFTLDGWGAGGGGALLSLGYR
jgi:hypothetical protein